ncbi:DNA-binding protein [Alicyclobacillus tolerans]|uniref:PPC domain-containing DNA-binding protein n=1 Tax=Alicyclobacillus tolerans TaxID=90970 RepID=UPI001F3030CF|nr:PPC domain-containing DNA-binding protein [Alicyclobacillus tolerans]MCF8565034.1 DNA-binding protein [Alicyclobacillus tolerans]
MAYKAAPGSLENIYVVRLLPGTDLIQGIEEFAQREGITHGVILSMLGTLKDGAFRNPRVDTTLPILREYEGADQIDTFPFERPVEIVGGAGNLFPKEDKIEAHIHLVVSKDGAQTMAGHLFRGTIWTQAEIAIAKLSGMQNVYRKYEGDTGLWQIQVE